MPDDPAATWLVVVGLASLSAATSWIGVVLALRIGDRPQAVATGIGFSAGIMIVISAAELIPEAYRAADLPTVVMGTGLGAGLLWVLHVAIPHIHLAEEAGGDSPVRLSSAYLVATGVELYPSLNAAFLAFAAGAMIFVSVSELYPMGRRLGHLGHFAIGAATAIPTYAILQLVIVH